MSAHLNMEMESTLTGVIRSPTPHDIDEALSAQGNRGGFITLRDADGTWVEALEDDDDRTFGVFRYDCAQRQHYVLDIDSFGRDVVRRDVLEIYVRFLNHDPNWTSRYPWEEIEAHGWLAMFLMMLGLPERGFG